MLLTGSGGNSDELVVRAVLALLGKPEAFEKLFGKSYVIYYSILTGRWGFFTYLSAGSYFDNIMVPELLGNLSCQASSNTTAKANNNITLSCFEGIGVDCRVKLARFQNRRL